MVNPVDLEMEPSFLGLLALPTGRRLGGDEGWGGVGDERSPSCQQALPLTTDPEAGRLDLVPIPFTQGPLHSSQQGGPQNKRGIQAEQMPWGVSEAWETPGRAAGVWWWPGPTLTWGSGPLSLGR